MLSHRLKTVNHNDADVSVRYKVVGLKPLAPTSASTQGGTAPAGDLVVRTNLESGYVIIDGHIAEISDETANIVVVRTGNTTVVQGAVLSRREASIWSGLEYQTSIGSFTEMN